MQRWTPHVTVATVVPRHGRYLLVEERDKLSGDLVFNQPAGHLEQGESLGEAALRETLEETGWHVELQGLLGVALYTAPGSGITYQRTTFLARPLQLDDNTILDPDIHAVHWLDYQAIQTISARMRSSMVLWSIEQHLKDQVYPLDFLSYFPLPPAVSGAQDEG